MQFQTSYRSGTAVFVAQLILASFALLACSEELTVSPSVEETTPVRTVELNPTSASLAIGTALQLSATARDSAGNALPNVSVQWSSSNVAVASVDGSGLVLGLAQGTATITATADAASGSASVTVVAGDPPPPGNDPRPPAVGDPRILFDLRAGSTKSKNGLNLQNITNPTDFFGLFDYTQGRVSFGEDFDGAGTNAVRIKWTEYLPPCDCSPGVDAQTAWVRRYLPTPLPHEIYFQYRWRMGRHPNDTGGFGNVNQYNTYNPNCNCSAGRKMKIFWRELEDHTQRWDTWFQGSNGSGASKHLFQPYNAPQKWTTPWNPDSHVAEELVITFHIRAQSAPGVLDGALSTWINGQLIDHHDPWIARNVVTGLNESTGDLAFYVMELPSTYTAPLYNQTEYYWDIVIWRP